MLELVEIDGLPGWVSQQEAANIFSVTDRGFRSCIARYIPPGMSKSLGRGKVTMIHAPSLIYHYMVTKVEEGLPGAGGELEEMRQRVLQYMGARIAALERELARLGNGSMKSRRDGGEACE